MPWCCDTACPEAPVMCSQQTSSSEMRVPTYLCFSSRRQQQRQLWGRERYSH